MVTDAAVKKRLLVRRFSQVAGRIHTPLAKCLYDLQTPSSTIFGQHNVRFQCPKVDLTLGMMADFGFFTDDGGVGGIFAA